MATPVKRAPFYSETAQRHQSNLNHGTGWLPSNKIAILAIGIIALASLPRADGGPVSFVACMAACAAAAFFNPFFIPSLPACHMACDMIGVLPTP